MKTCPWCEGKKVTGQLMRGEDGATVNVLGVQIPLMVMADRACGICDGTGQVTDERHAQLTTVCHD